MKSLFFVEISPSLCAVKSHFFLRVQQINAQKMLAKKKNCIFAADDEIFTSYLVRTDDSGEHARRL
jgi:hypothetical protein